ncbi:MAG: C10 family peptidase [Prevotella sp.]|nr:C10 family peptidase [Prevotella sp.]
MRNIYYLVIVVGLFIFTMVEAEPITYSEAQTKAIDFLSQKGKKLKIKNLAYKAPSKNSRVDSENAYYVFNIGEKQGFVIVSGDDRVSDIIGYSDNGSFVQEALPLNARAWLDEYANQIQWLKDNNIPAMKNKSPLQNNGVVERAKAPIYPLLESKWNQGNPYNDKTPIYYRNGKGSHCATGCVATAMAQVLNYYKYPKQIIAEIPGYTLKKIDGKDTLIVFDPIPAGTEIDWDNMLNEYGNGSYTDVQKEAVSNLMYYCGVAVEMGYGPSSGSGVDVAERLKAYFDFDSASKVVAHNDYPIDEWENMVYNELYHKRPVYYTGFNTSAGHAFVCDGYDGDGYFHINWGWGGGSDGYFKLTLLNSNYAGIGSSPGGYSMYCSMLINGQPNTGAEYPVEEKEIKLQMSQLRVEGTTIYYSAYNETGEPHAFEMGPAILEEDGSLIPIITNSTIEVNHGWGWGQWGFDLSKGNLTPGKHVVIPVSRAIGTDIWFSSRRADNKYAEVNVLENGTISSIVLHPILDMEVVDVEIDPVGFSNPRPITVKIQNNGDEYRGELHLFVSMTDEKGEKNDSQAASIHKGELKDIVFECTAFKDATVYGDWNLWISTDTKGENIIGHSTFKLVYPNFSNFNYKVESIDIKNLNQIGDSSYLYGKNLEMSIVLRNMSTNQYYNCPSYLVVSKKGENGEYQQVSSLNSGYQSLVPGKTATYTFSYNRLVEGEEYKIVAKYYGYDAYKLYEGTFIVKPGFLIYRQDGSSSMQLLETETTIGEDVVAVDFSTRNMSNYTINPNSNPNTLYMFASSRPTVPSGLENCNLVKNKRADKIVLTDGYDFYTPTDITVSSISYSRIPKKGSNGKGNWDTMVLPFAPTSIIKAEDGSELTWFKSGDEKGKNMWIKEFIGLASDDKVVFDHAQELKANIPYIIAVPGDRWGENWNLSGKKIIFTADNVTLKSNSRMKTETSIYDFVGNLIDGVKICSYSLNEGGTSFLLGDNHVGSFRAFFKPLEQSATSGVNQLMIVSPNGTETTSIDGIEDNINGTNLPYYNLQGVRVEYPSHGIYIRNGRKVIIK